MARRRQLWGAAAVGLTLCLASAPSSAAEVLRIGQADCRVLAVHRPAPDVAFRPGRDTRGRPVAPADLAGGAGLQLPETLEFAIEVDLAERLGLEPAEIGADLPLGVVTLRGEEVHFNGQPLAPGAEEELADLCRAALSAGHGNDKGEARVP